MEYAVFALVLFLVLILTFYNRRQARALEYMARLEEDRTAREMQTRRERKAKELDIRPLEWLEGMVNSELEQPIKLNSTTPKIHLGVEAMELVAEDGRKLVVSTLPPASIRHYDRLQRRLKGKGAAARLTGYANVAIFGNRLRVWKTIRTMADMGEFFDIEASEVGRSLGLPWGAPTRLWFYVLSA